MQLSHWYLSQSTCEAEMATVKFEIYNRQIPFIFQQNDVEQSF